jgi:HEAT repeat protein
VSIVNQVINKHELPDWMRVTILGQVQSESSKQILISYLKHQDVHIVRKAAQFIGETIDQEASKTLLSKLEEIDTQFFNQKSFGIGGQTGNLWTLHIEALAYINPQKAINFLYSKLIDPGSEEWRMIIHLSTGAPQLLMNLDGESVLPILIENLRHLQLKERPLIQTDTKNEISESQEAVSNQRKNEMIFENQKSMIFSLIKYSGDYELVIKDLIQILDLEQSPNSKSQLIRLLGSSNHIEINKVLIKSLTDSEFKIKKEACLQLIERQLQDNDIEDLLNLTKSEDWETSWTAAFVLGSLGHQEPISILAEAMQTNKPTYRSTALPRMTAKALSHLDSSVALPILLNVIHENSERNIFFTGVVWEVAFSLSKFGCKEIIPILIEASNSGYLDECKRGIQGLAKLGVEDPLCAILKQKSVGWQTAVVELVKIGREEFLPDLCAALIELGSASANEVMKLLSKCADVDTVAWFLEALRNSEKHGTDPLFLNRVAFVLARSRSDILQHRLQDLVDLLLDKHIEQLFWVIPTIQNRCQFYNYEVWQAAMQQQAVAEQKATQGNRQANTVVNIGTFHAPNSAINLGGTVKGDQVGTQEESPNP